MSDDNTTTPSGSQDLCDSLDNEKEYFCHVCMTDGKVHYAKINAEQGRGTVYGSEVPTCARIPRNSKHLSSFAKQCFPAGMGYVRNEFFPGHDTMACDEIPVTHDNTATRRRKPAAIGGGVVVFLLLIVGLVMLCKSRHRGPKTAHFGSGEPTIVHIPLKSLRHA